MSLASKCEFSYFLLQEPHVENFASAGAKILPPKRQIAVLAGKKFSPLMNNRKPGIHGAFTFWNFVRGWWLDKDWTAFLWTRNTLDGSEIPFPTTFWIYKTPWEIMG